MSATLFLLFVSFGRETIKPEVEETPSEVPVETLDLSTQAEMLLTELELEKDLGIAAFEKAFKGYHTLLDRKKELLTVIDFSKPSTEERMFVIDMKAKKVLYRTIVSHGRNSGGNYATEFSNRHGSFQSSLGFYLTGETYMGGNGYSLYINGLEKDINDQARARAVVIHGADYCSYDFIKRTGRLGRSYGCPALPRAVNKEIINTIKEGSVLFIYAENEQYAMNSSVLREASQQARVTPTGTRIL
jgi:hypothetical protein